MKYRKIVKGIFLSRPNRFIALVLINKGDGAGPEEERVHVKNTGRCKELLVEGCTVFLEESDKAERKTKYDLVAVEKKCDKNSLLINMDSQAPNKAASEWIESPAFLEALPFIKKLTFVKAEYVSGKSRFDFYLEYESREGKSEKMYLEVKGVTLEKNGLAMFPDAPTLRGLKHVKELTQIVKEKRGRAAVLFVIQMKGVNRFSPNRETHEDFANALVQAQKDGVLLLARDCIITPDSMTIDQDIFIQL